MEPSIRIDCNGSTAKLQVLLNMVIWSCNQRTVLCNFRVKYPQSDMMMMRKSKQCAKTDTRSSTICRQRLFKLSFGEIFVDILMFLQMRFPFKRRGYLGRLKLKENDLQKNNQPQTITNTIQGNQMDIRRDQSYFTHKPKLLQYQPSATVGCDCASDSITS